MPATTVDGDAGVETAATLSLSEDLVQSPSHKAATTQTIDFDGLLQPALALHEDLRRGNGGQVWPAGMILARYLLQNKRDELSQASMPRDAVHITDQESMLDLMQRNIALNVLGGHVKASVYDWGSARPENIPHHPDVVLAADCVYFEPAFPLLQQTLLDLIGPSTVCYFCFKRRRRADLHFMKAAKKAFLVEDVTDDAHRAGYARENIFL